MSAVIAHRGASAEAPENSLAAMDLAVALGADAIELDAREARDGTLFCIHDATLDRTTDGTGELARLTREDVARVRLADGSPVPELKRVLERLAGIRVTVDVKERAAAGAVAALVRRLRRIHRTTFYVEDGTETSAFQFYSGRRATSTAQALRLAREPDWFSTAREREIPEVIHTPLQLDGETIVTPEFVARVRATGRWVQVWTIDELETARELASWGVDGIITNDVRGMRTLFSGYRPTGGSFG